ncbi:hypothetical protein [Glycomyces sp. YM15]|uniref:hypothetical protein n=1 Tax=Glycomyces sp. YM15 TaxID=2800446 RepID=UPI00196386FE|nr:hypothetical protein [Glycomyces sp. YM15]
MDVLAAAGLAVEPGSPRPRFDQTVWDFTGLAHAPAIMGTHHKVLDFSIITNPHWQSVAREYLMARIAPLHPAVAVLPRAFRTPLSPMSWSSELKHLRDWFNHLTDSGLTRLGQVAQEHCDTFLESVSMSRNTPGQMLTPGALTVFIRAVKYLELYSEILSDAYQPEFRPWANRSADEIAGYQRSTMNRTLPVPDTLLGPLLANTRYLIDVIGPHLAIEAQHLREADHRQATAQGGPLPASKRPAIRDAIERRRVHGVPAPQISPTGFTTRVRSGWDTNDPLTRLAWHPIVLAAAGKQGRRIDLERFRPELERWIGECGFELPWGRNATLVPRLDNNEMVPWTLPTHRSHLRKMTSTITTAAFLVTATLSGMRSSELLEIEAGAHRLEERPNGTRYRVISRRIKGEPFGGVEDSWVVIEAVYRALERAQDVTGTPPGQLLFANNPNPAHSRYVRMREWINGPSGRRLGLEPLPEGPVHPRALRRTLALMIAQRPHGLMAAKIQLKHISTATTEGYAARPGGHQAAFLAEVSAAEEAEHTRLTVEAYDQYRQGVMPTGQGARDLIATFQTVDQALDRHEPGPVTVIDDRRVERLLKAKAKNLHVGVGNYCWFTDPRKALCLTLAGNTEATEPLLGLCDSARCSQATHHPRHREVWADHAEQTRVVFLGNPRLSKLERARAQETYDRSMRIVNEIDTAASEQEESDEQ